MALAMSLVLAGKPQPGRTGQQVNRLVRCNSLSPHHHHFIQCRRSAAQVSTWLCSSQLGVSR
jgi:hypothetical protein